MPGDRANATAHAVLNAADPLAATRNNLRILADMAGEWAGIPMQVEGDRLQIAEGYPFKELYDQVADERERKEPQEKPDFEIINTWWHRRYRCDVGVGRNREGKPIALKFATHSTAEIALRTMAMAPVWGFEQESKATHKLADLVNHSRFRSYMLAGQFMERSRRSGLYYIFRRGRPTLVMKADENKPESSPKILCALCMHPIGYYESSLAGAMCPTDDVIAHLTMMRGDEHMYWKRSNQHSVHRPEAML